MSQANTTVFLENGSLLEQRGLIENEKGGFLPSFLMHKFSIGVVSFIFNH